MELYRFRPRRFPVVTRYLVDFISSISGLIRVSLDLGLSYEFIKVGDGVVRIGDCELSMDELSLLRYDYVYVVRDCGVMPVSFFRGRFFYKLYPVSMYTAPTLEISGIKMHRVVGITPWEDAGSKVDVLGDLSGSRVLDICTGLGYTAIHALRRGGRVTSIEVDENVLEVASYNPWSWGLEKVELVLGDAFEVVRDFDDGSFDVIIHDPPRFSRAGELYGRDFYVELFRVLSHGGKMFHYTGRVGYMRRGLDLVRSVARRLSVVGFRVRLLRGLRGVLAHKP